MKAITLWQPFASAMAQGIKRNETRAWPTNYRGDVVIVSAIRVPTVWETTEEFHRLAKTCPRGYALCVVELFDCVETKGIRVAEQERKWGNYCPGRFAWLTRNVRAFDPIKVLGRQRIFNLPAAVARQIRAALDPMNLAIAHDRAVQAELDAQRLGKKMGAKKYKEGILA